MAYWTKIIMAATCAAALTGSAGAQNPAPGLIAPADPAVAPPSASTVAAGDLEWMRQGLAAARSGDLDRARQAQAAIAQPVARKLVEWAMVDAMANRLSFAELDQDRRDLQAWPRRANRQLWAERAIETSGLSAQQIVDWFGRADPQSPEGAMSLAGALQQLGRTADAQALIRHVWRDKAFEADAQRAMLARFGALLTPEDHIRRADALLYGQQGPAVRDMLPLLPADVQAVALARIALRANADNANDLLAAVPADHAHDPGLAVERARYLYQHQIGVAALPLLADFPRDVPEDAASRFWMLRRQLVNVAIQAGDYRSAYRAVDDHGLPPGPDAADAEFLGGWIALTKLKDPALAERHFARLESMGASPITQSRGFYWRGRAEEAAGDPIAAQTYYGQGARYSTAFYGQLAAAKAGVSEIVLDRDPVPTPADRARFEANEIVQAARMLAQSGQADLFRTMVIAATDNLTSACDAAMLVDLVQTYADQELYMRVIRLAAQHGFALAERGYPLRTPPGSPPVETPFILGIVRQESGFDPRIRSGAGARGMMQLMPTTARVLASRAGLDYRADMLDDPDYNMRLGAGFLGQLVTDFDGSYLMATAAYNAGPGRPPQWTAACGDPRGGGTDPVDYIECIPIGETRNYVMRVLENMQVYRARLNGGHAPLTLAADLKRGGYGQPAIDTQLAGSGGQVSQNTATAPPATGAAPSGPMQIVASTPIANPPEPIRPIPIVDRDPVFRTASHGRGRERESHGGHERHAHAERGKAGKAHVSHGGERSAHGKKHKHD